MLSKPRCKKLEVLLSPGEDCEFSGETIETKFGSCLVKIEFAEKEIMTILADDEIKALSLWEAFLSIYVAQAFCFGYFFPIDSVNLHEANESNSNTSVGHWEYWRNNMTGLFFSDSGFVNHLSLGDYHTLRKLLHEDTLAEYKKLNDVLIILTNGFWYQSANTQLPVDMRCAGLIQCFENLGLYIAKTCGEEDIRLANKHKNSNNLLSASMKYLIKKYHLPSLFNDATDDIALDEFTRRAIGTRNKMMHFDVFMTGGFLSSIECTYYARILHIYFRYILLSLVGVEVSELANSRIENWQERLANLKMKDV